ncbi:MAG: DUF371 domain-containing protein [Theionarchaea archaeon]|nr:MAG: hypothetical protein AYK18_06220 [Theionarchaea archaeon DG-70]MBU7009495.1 DUF371 domain-containing protein [Theionarchaea archaeon]
MKHVFHCYGHENIRATHYKTIEFTRDSHLTVKGDCIIGVKADFDASELKKLKGKVRITVEVNRLKDTFKAVINPYFDNEEEIVFRKSTYSSKRTLGHKLNRGANRLERSIVELMQNPHTVMKVTIEEITKKRS